MICWLNLFVHELNLISWYMNGKAHVRFFWGPSKLVNLHLSAAMVEQQAAIKTIKTKWFDILFCFVFIWKGTSWKSTNHWSVNASQLLRPKTHKNRFFPQVSNFDWQSSIFSQRVNAWTRQEKRWLRQKKNLSLIFL